MTKKPCFRTLFDSQHARGSHLLPKSLSPLFYHIFPSFLEKWSSKKSLIVISEILGLFVNSWQKYSLRNRENFLQPIQMHLSTSIFEHFENKYDPYKLCISKIMDCERRGQINV